MEFLSSLCAEEMLKVEVKEAEEKCGNEEGRSDEEDSSDKCGLTIVEKSSDEADVQQPRERASRACNRVAGFGETDDNDNVDDDVSSKDKDDDERSVHWSGSDARITHNFLHNRQGERLSYLLLASRQF